MDEEFKKIKSNDPLMNKAWDAFIHELYTQLDADENFEWIIDAYQKSYMKEAVESILGEQ